MAEQGVNLVLDLSASLINYVRRGSTINRQLLRDVVSKLDYLKPLLIEIIEIHKNPLLNRPKDNALHELIAQVEIGKSLIENCQELKGRLFNIKKIKCNDKLVILDKFLTPWMDRLPLQTSALRSELLMSQQIDELRRTNERYEALIHSPAATEAAVETQLDIQIQPFSGRIQNWVCNRSYGSWAILFMIPFFLSMVIAATGSTGTKWILFNIGINNLGINNN